MQPARKQATVTHMSDAATLSKEDVLLYRQLPSNTEAEQALLGAILVNNEALHHIGDRLRPEHFLEPVHARIFEAILTFHDKGQIATPVTLKHYFDSDESLRELGGGSYLAKMAGAAIHVLNIRDYSSVIYDLSLKRQLIQIGEHIVNTAYDQKLNEEAMTQIERAEQELFLLSESGDTEGAFKALKFSLQGAVSRAEELFESSGTLPGVDTGLTDMNDLTGGMQNSDLIILAGRPSMGKTALATTIAFNACKTFVREAEEKNIPVKDRKSVGFFSLEMSGEQLATRLLSAACKINAAKMLRGQLSREEFDLLIQQQHALQNMPFYIDDTPALSIAALRARARRLKRVHNLGFLVVDYLQLVRPSSTRGDNRVQEVSEITQGLKAIAKELNIPVMALSQLSRAVESRDDKRPMLSDLRESGSIEQDADVVMFVFREEYYVGRREPDIEKEEEYRKWQEDMERVLNVAEVIVAKHRNGPIGTARMFFDGSLARFADLENARAYSVLPE